MAKRRASGDFDDIPTKLQKPIKDLNDVYGDNDAFESFRVHIGEDPKKYSVGDILMFNQSRQQDDSEKDYYEVIEENGELTIRLNNGYRPADNYSFNNDEDYGNATDDEQDATDDEQDAGKRSRKGGRKTRKGRKGRKTRKSRKSRKGRKTRKGRKSTFKKSRAKYL